MKKSRRHPAYWHVRFMLAVAILAPPAALLLLSSWVSGLTWLQGWGLPVLAVGVVLWLAGVTWMIRIFRGPNDEPPPWRYRDR